jgi:hypothetical protein
MRVALFVGICAATASSQNAVPMIEARGANLTLSADDVMFELGSGVPHSMSSMVASVGGAVQSIQTLEGSASTAVEARFSRAEDRITAIENDDQAGRIATLETALRVQNLTVAALAANVSTLTARLNSLLNAPPPPNIPIRSCRDAIERNPRAPSGVTVVQPEGFEEGFPVYCEHDLYGGGWTLVEKVVVGPRGAWAANGVTTAEQFFAIALDPEADTNPSLLLDANLSGMPVVASLSRGKTNAIARYSDGVGDRLSAVVRVDMVQNAASPSLQGVYMQSKNGDTTQFDYWAALRDGRVWGDMDVEGVHVANFGTSFSLAKEPSSFNPARNTFSHAVCGDPNYGHWDVNPRTVNGETLTFSRHGGLLNDGYCGLGNLWLYTMSENDARFLNDANRRSNVYIR